MEQGLGLIRKIRLAMDVLIVAVVPAALIILGSVGGAITAAVCGLAVVVWHRRKLDKEVDPMLLAMVYGRSQVGSATATTRVMGSVAIVLTVAVAINICVAIYVNDRVLWVVLACLGVVWFSVGMSALAGLVVRKASSDHASGSDR